MDGRDTIESVDDLKLYAMSTRSGKRTLDSLGPSAGLLLAGAV